MVHHILVVILAFAFLDNEAIWFGKNGVWVDDDKQKCKWTTTNSSFYYE